MKNLFLILGLLTLAQCSKCPPPKSFNPYEPSMDCPIYSISINDTCRCPPGTYYYKNRCENKEGLETFWVSAYCSEPCIKRPFLNTGLFTSSHDGSFFIDDENGWASGTGGSFNASTNHVTGTIAFIPDCFVYENDSIAFGRLIAYAGSNQDTIYTSIKWVDYNGRFRRKTNIIFVR